MDIFMDYHQICIYIRAALLHGELVVTVYFIKFQFPSCDRTLSILRRIKGNTVVCVFNASVKHRVEMSRNVQSGNTQNLKSMVIQRSFPKWSVAERRKTAAASDQAAVCACAHSRYFAGGSPSGLRV